MTSLRYPIYLDVPMMMGFLAYLTGGVAESQDETRTTVLKEKEARALGVKAAPLPVFEFSGRYTSEIMASNSEEVRLIRQHTSASLFNLLYDRLREKKLVINLWPGRSEPNEGLAHVADVKSGQIIEAQGEFVGNPMEDWLALVDRLTDFVEGGTSDNSTQNEQARFSRLMREDMNKSPVIDILLHSDAPNGSVGEQQRLVATASREFLTYQAASLLRSSTATIIGKVSHASKITYMGLRDPISDDPINLARRTPLGLLKTEEIQAVLIDPALERIQGVYHGAGLTAGLKLDPGDLLVHAPAIQVIPLAVFV
jgi:hypothetical protein